MRALSRLGTINRPQQRNLCYCAAVQLKGADSHLRACHPKRKSRRASAPFREREATSIKTLIDDMRRIAGLLEDDFSAEKERSRVRGYSEAECSILAKTLAERRDNLKATISVLEDRL